MDRKKIKRQRTTLSVTFLKWLCLFSITVLLIFIGIYWALTVWLTQLLQKPSLAGFLDSYRQPLFAQEYTRISRHDLQGCEFVVLNEDDSPLYASSPAVKVNFSPIELQCIQEYPARRHYSVSLMQKGKGSYLITESFRSNGVDMIDKYCVLDENFRVVSGTLFPKDTVLSKTEFQFINGEYNQKYNVVKYAYEDDSGEKRTLVFYSPRRSLQRDEISVERWNQIWYLLIPLFLLVLAIFGFLISREIKRYLQPLNAALLGIPSGQPADLQNYRGPREFVEIARNFDRVTEQLEESERQKKELDSQRRQMLMDISHDLKTPITVIQGYAKAICDEIIPHESVPHYAELIYHKATAVSELTAAFLEYSTITHPGFGLETARCDLCEYLKEYFGEKYEELEEKGFSLTAELPDEPIFCELDIPKFRRILENIVNNSMRYNPHGTEIFCGLQVQEQFALLTLGDKGIGIPPEICDTLFDAFVTGDRSRGPGGGHGLGMAIVKNLTEAHGGTVELVCKPENGLKAEFRLLFPLASGSP